MPYDYHPSVPSPQGLQLQTGAYRSQDIFSTQSSRFPIPQHSHPYQPQDIFPFYEPFSERPALSHTFSISNPIHAGDRRVLPDLPWYSDRMQPSTDWLRPEDCVRDRSSGLVAEEPSIPPQKAVPSSPQGPQGVLQGNEVITSSLHHPSALLMDHLSRSIFSRSYILPRPHRTPSSSRALLSHQTNKRLYFFNRS
jgi:hypothetical protein